MRKSPIEYPTHRSGFQLSPSVTTRRGSSCRYPAVITRRRRWLLLPYNYKFDGEEYERRMANLPIDLQIARDQLVRINDALSKPHLLIGGLAVQRYVVARDSKDIDLVCESAVARELLRSLFPSDDWTVENLNDDEYRPSFVARHRWRDLGEICFGPKISERRAYDYIDWAFLLATAVPYVDRGKPLERIRIPTCCHLAYTKLLSFLSRDKGKREKRLQDLQDFVDLTNHDAFCPNEFLSQLRRTDAWSFIAANFRVTAEEDAILERSCLRKMSILFGVGALLPVMVTQTPSSPPAIKRCEQHECDLLAPKDARIRLVSGHSADKYKEEQLIALMEAVFKEHGLAGQYKIEKLDPGSVVITLTLSAADAERLCELVQSGSYLRFGALSARVIQLGRRDGVDCDQTWRWLSQTLAQALSCQPSTISKCATFGDLGFREDQVVSLLLEAGATYDILDIHGRFEAYIEELHGLHSVESWSIVPVGDLCDFIHENHRLGAE